MHPQKMKYKVGQHIIVWSMMEIAKIESVRKSGSLVTLWIKGKNGSYPISSLDQNIFVVKVEKHGFKQHETKLTKINSLINLTGLITLFILLNYFFGG